MADPYFSQFNTSNYYGSSPPPRGPSFFGLGSGTPGQPSSSVEGILQAVGPMIAEMFRDQFGGYSFMFGSDMNAASSRMANQFMKELGASRQQGAQADQEQVKQLFRGLAVAIGNKFERDPATGKMDLAPNVRDSIDVLSRDAGMMLPILASAFPDTLDRVLPRGSMAVAATSFTNAGRFLIDPATGLPASRDAGMAARVLEPLTKGDPQLTYGLGAGRLGQIYEELVSRGMVGSGRDLRDQVQLRDSTGMGGLSGDEARAIQADRIRQVVTGYSRAVSAINDIFSENGRSNAPMPELIRSLEALTQGGMSIYSDGRLGEIARTLQAASQSSGIGLEGLSQLAAFGDATSQRFGGARGLGAPLAIKAAAYGMVFADRDFGKTLGPDAMNRNEFIESIVATKARFSGSPVGNALGAISALGRQAPAGSEFAQLAEAVRRGETRVEIGGKTIDLASDLSQVNEIARRSGLGDAYLSQLMATTMNKAEFTNVPGLSAAGDTLQRQQYENQFLNFLGADFAGIDQGKLLKAVYDASNMELKFGDADAAKIAGDRLNLNASQRSRLAQGMSLIGQATGFGDRAGYNAFRRFNPENRADAEKFESFLKSSGLKQEQLSGLMRGGWMRNISTMFIQAGAKGEMGPNIIYDILRSAGMVTNEEVARALGQDDVDIVGSLAGFLGNASLAGRTSRNASVMGGPLAVGVDLPGAMQKSERTSLLQGLDQSIQSTQQKPETPSLLQGLSQAIQSTQQKPETPSLLQGLSQSIQSVQRKKNPFREGIEADKLGNEGGAGMTGALLEVGKRVAKIAGGKVSSNQSGPLQISIAKLIVSRDGSASLQSEGSAKP